ncbi:hypothetical protein BVRB_4g077480 [Beta vulgaris subsp. vulgaris]|nr:hypothetical protein BVRB_4g077480 [Beta vulgaris subsp. vulgaris]
MVGDHFEASLSGRFQCRQDLDDHKCNECMKTFQNVSSNGFCGNSMAARIQLSGCHVQYEADVYNDIFSLDDELNNKKSCGENQAVMSSEYFEQMKSQALVALESEVAGGGGDGNNGFYSIKHEGFHAMVQCEVGIDECKCATCVVDAVEALEKECVSSISGQVYLGLCYLSYEFNPHEIHGAFHAEEKHKAGFGKIVAIAIGGVALLFIVLLLFRCLKKKDDDW